MSRRSTRDLGTSQAPYPVRRILVELYFNLAPRIAGAIVTGHRGLKLYGGLCR
ncbi:MAG: hypothetical protein QW405_00590 [Fervidicoccaceae archaeon]